MNSNESRNIWIGLVEVKPNQDQTVLGDAEGAFVNIVCVATGADTFARYIAHAIEDLDLTLVAINNAQPLGRAMEQKEIDEDLIKSAAALREPGELAWGAFHAYQSSEEGSSADESS